MGTEETYHGHGKILLTGEYFCLSGALALALPTNVGQKMTVKYRSSFSPKLSWKSYDYKGELWFEHEFEFWHFNSLEKSLCPVATKLQNILREARKLNRHFLRDEVDVEVKTYLEFPIKWGLGSSSSLVYIVAQWAYVSPFALLKNTFKGSGYDIACAQSNGPILFESSNDLKSYAPVPFNPEFKDSLYFVYLEEKVSTADAIEEFTKLEGPFDGEIIQINRITREILQTKNLKEFENLIREHEEIVANAIKKDKIKWKKFSEYWGEIKSLGAWGGDFVLVTSDRSHQETRDYFFEKGHRTVISFNELIINSESKLQSHEISRTN